MGTTSVRALESLHVAADGTVTATRRDVALRSPGHQFRLVRGLVTNFHLPKSSLLMLVSAFAGRERVLAAYREAVERRLPFLQLRRRHAGAVSGEGEGGRGKGERADRATSPEGPACAVSAGSRRLQKKNLAISTRQALCPSSRDGQRQVIRDLVVWQKSMALAESCYHDTEESYPRRSAGARTRNPQVMHLHSIEHR